MVVDDFNVERITRAPVENYAPLLIHADTMLSSSVSLELELFELVSGRDSEIFKNRSGIQHSEFPKCHARNIRPELYDGVAPKEALGVGVPKALDHVE